MSGAAGQLPDPLEVYRQLRQRIAQVLADAHAGCGVPACPDWDAIDVLRHLVGVAEDVAAGDVDGFASHEWSAAQVRRHERVDVAELLRRWQEVSRRLPDALPAVDQRVPGIASVGIAMAFDALVHEQDLRSALGLRPVPTDASLVLMSKISLVALRDRRRAATGHLLIHLEDGAVFDAGGDGPDRHLHTTRLEVWRALSGRRTRAEVAGMAWSDPPPDDLATTWMDPVFDWPEVSVGT
jgi:uncharacterized protein (TIGR03083 family)